MPKSSNQKLKLLCLKQVLLEKTDEEHPLTIAQIISELEQRYGVSAERKSLYEDFEALKLLNVDVIKTADKSTGYYIGTRDFELPELKLLVDLVGASKFITYKKSRELMSKLELLASVHQAKLLQRQIHVSDRVKTMNESIYYNVDMIHNGIDQNKKINFLYFEYTVSKESKFKKNGAPYIISPFALSWSDDNYYLVGFDSEAKMIKHYRVDKMKSISVTKEAREGAEEFAKHDMSIYSRKFFGMFGGREENVKLLFKNELAGVVIDRFGKDIALKPYNESDFYVDTALVVSPQFFGWIASFGGKAKILSPSKVNDEYKRYITLSITE